MIQNHITNQRPAFSMLTAVGVMLIMGLLSSYILSTSASTGEETFAQYHKEQAVLLSEAYTEAAILAILNNNMALAGANCVTNFGAGGAGVDITTLIQGAVADATTVLQGKGYHVDVNIHYIANKATNPRPTNFTTTKCSTILNLDSGGNLLDFNATIPGDPNPVPSVSAIIDVYVRYRNMAYPDPSTAPWVTYHRRTLQKI